MNDIEILEEKLKQWEPYKNVKWTTEIEKQIALENQAIENLIKENKELELNLDFKNKELEKLYDTEEKYIKDNYISKDKIKELAKKYEYASVGYDSSTADYKQSQDIGRYIAYVELLKGE